MKEGKKPDMVVWDSDRGYYQNQLTYGSNHSAPAIKLDDVTGWKQSQIMGANKQFSTKYEELKEEFRKLVEEVNISEMLYSAKCNFLPIVGEIYHLYEGKDGLFLSLIEPNSWNQKYVGSYKLNSTQKWTKV